MQQAINKLRSICDRISQLAPNSNTPKVDPSVSTASTSSTSALNFKVDFRVNQEPLPFLEGVFIQEKGKSFALIGDKKVEIHDYWVERYSLKPGEKIGVVPTKRWDYVEPGCIKRLSSSPDT